ncbi:lipoate-protein ligase B [Sulfobacillus acidophilus TPY]|uniref:Octanoyltransferase n=1 Tax=Sulfobacillus acidophilus (strain ATCC 700253 / DSM 10332 / NAL) TaxID=679936 RepID=G8TUF3_SULAD|nr:lipoate-protein ligase B [Sulfobacillus acidophilus TPY]AEW06915.1 Octanoyltransferase [Sulfobacillus acidophilus DSM 10332]
MPTAWTVDLGSMAYQPAWDLQRRVGQKVLDGEWPDVVLTVEHPPVYTVGRAAHGTLTNLLWDEDHLQAEGIEVFQVDRGGDITYHGPGQLVGYPILNLNRYGRDLHLYLRRLEDALIRALLVFGIEAGRMPPHTGVWVGNEKIAAIGVKASRWVTQHGFALNVDPNLAHFSGIIPCGIQDKGVTSMRRLLDRPVTLAEVRPVVLEKLAEVFSLTLTTKTLSELEMSAAG